MRIAVLAFVAATTLAHADRACDSLEVCTKRCDAGSQDSCAVLGITYFRHHDLVKAEPLLDRACKAKAAVGCGALGALYATRKDWKRARPLFESACKMGDAQSCENLADLTINGDDSPVTDSKLAAEKAAVYFRRACDFGSGRGCAIVAAWINGSIVAGTAKEALELYTKACSSGAAVACRKGAGFLREPMFTRSPFAKTVDVERVSADLVARGCKLGDAESCDWAKHPLPPIKFAD